LFGNKVLKIILDLRKKSIYYPITAEASPDIPHQEQNIFILKYVFQNKRTVVVNLFEGFIKFIHFNENTTQLISRLECFKIPPVDCRIQGYNNGVNMLGKIKLEHLR